MSNINSIPARRKELDTDGSGMELRQSYILYKKPKNTLILSGYISDIFSKAPVVADTRKIATLISDLADNGILVYENEGLIRYSIYSKAYKEQIRVSIYTQELLVAINEQLHSDRCRVLPYLKGYQNGSTYYLAFTINDRYVKTDDSLFEKCKYHTEKIMERISLIYREAKFDRVLLDHKIVTN